MAAKLVQQVGDNWGCHLSKWVIDTSLGTSEPIESGLVTKSTSFCGQSVNSGVVSAVGTSSIKEPSGLIWEWHRGHGSAVSSEDVWTDFTCDQQTPKVRHGWQTLFFSSSAAGCVTVGRRDLISCRAFHEMCVCLFICVLLENCSC